MILAIDPGNVYSAYVLVEDDLSAIVQKEKLLNEELLKKVTDEFAKLPISHCAIERICSYGMPVGQEVFDTCVYIGRLMDRIESSLHLCSTLIRRKDEKICICMDSKANDRTIVNALVDEFAPGTPNHGKGYKKEPGYFYGFKADIWQAFAIAVTYHRAYIAGTYKI